MMLNVILLAVVLFSLPDGSFSVEGDTKQIDPGRSLILKAIARTDETQTRFEMPDFRDRARGFSLAEEGAEESGRDKDGRVTRVVEWRLKPEPCARVYKIAPFALGETVGGPIYFEPPVRETAPAGPMEIEEPKPDWSPPLPRDMLYATLALAVLVLVLWGVFEALKYLARRVKEHLMSPIERAWVELERLIKKGLPGRGRYKEFYVELTLVVRRYVQRQHGVKATCLTTEEFFDAARQAKTFPQSALDELIDFLRKADMIKFAGVKATSERSDEAIASARAYIMKDDEVVKRRDAQARRAP